MKKRIAIAYGGYSGEKVISGQSASVVLKHLSGGKFEPVKVLITREKWEAEFNNEGYAIDKNDFSFSVDGKKHRFDGVFIAIHGTPGETGLLQGYLEMQGIPYSSGSVLNSSLTFHKKFCNDLLKQYGIKSVVSAALQKGDGYSTIELVNRLGLPCFVKPNKGGSSLGITKVKHSKDLDEAIEKAFKEDDEIVLEPFIEGTEVTCGVTVYKGEIRALGVTEIVSPNEFFDYQAKYHDKLTQEITPARIPGEQYKMCCELTERIYQLLRCRGMIRADYIIKDNEFYLIEVNTVPGLSEASIIPKMADYANISLKGLFENECEMMLR